MISKLSYQLGTVHSHRKPNYYKYLTNLLERTAGVVPSGHV